jgi:hypothetical protein
LDGTVTVGVAPNAPETVTPTAVGVVFPEALDDADDDELDDGPGLEVEPHAASVTADAASNTARWREPLNTITSFRRGWQQQAPRVVRAVITAAWGVGESCLPAGAGIRGFPAEPGPRRDVVIEFVSV